MNTRSEASPPVIDEGVVETALHARVPGGAEVWCFLPQKDAWTPHETARDVIRAALEAGCAGLVAEMDALREELRCTMLAQPITEDGSTYSDGFASALAWTIGRLDARTALRGDREQGEG